MAAAGLMSVLALLFAAYAVRAIASIETERQTVQSSEALLGLNPLAANNATALSGALILAVSAVTLLTAIGVARRSAGARYAAILLFTMLAFVAFAASLTGLRADPPSPNALSGVLTGFANVAIVALLLAGSTAKDFQRAEHERQWLRARGRPLAPDRRA